MKLVWRLLHVFLGYHEWHAHGLADEGRFVLRRLDLDTGVWQTKEMTDEERDEHFKTWAIR